MSNRVILLCIVLGFVDHGAGEIDQSNPMRKTWWAQRITTGWYMAGKLSARQIKYASEDGFKSIIAIPTLIATTENDLEIYPDSQGSKDVAERLCGIPYEVVMEPGDSWTDRSTIERFTQLADQLPQPTLVMGDPRSLAAWTIINYLANKSKFDDTFRPKIVKSNFFQIASGFGFDYTGDVFKDTLKHTIGLEDGDELDHDDTPDIPMGTGWQQYWPANHVHKDIFTAGQIYSTHVQLIKQAGFKSIINNRRGKTSYTGDPSQEEVTLLNVKDRTGTYTAGGRQTQDALEKSRLDATKPNDYISNTSPVNYESRNALEFGDDIGFNEELDRKAVEDAGLVYYHHPIGDRYKYSVETWGAYKADMMEAIQRGPLLFHCRSSYRASVWALLVAGHHYGFNSTWALRRANTMGFDFNINSDEVKLWKAVLDDKASNSSPTCVECMFQCRKNRKKNKNNKKKTKCIFKCQKDKKCVKKNKNKKKKQG